MFSILQLLSQSVIKNRIILESLQITSVVIYNNIQQQCRNMTQKRSNISRCQRAFPLILASDLLDEVNLVPVSGVSSAARCRCAVRPLRNSDTPPQCPTSIYLDWKNSDDQSFWKTTTYFDCNMNFIQLQSSLLCSTPALFYLTVWSVVRVKEKTQHQSGQRAATVLL